MSQTQDPARKRGIRFLLNGEPLEVGDIDPTLTALEFLREFRGLKGTKEGCAEGDCGACTIAVVELDGDALRYRAVNACICFLATLDGKALITVEGLVAQDGALHPVQRAMLEHHGSQCGFCTPGIVMSLFTLRCSAARPDDAQVAEALSGNLCRCTGYRPIFEAVRHLHEHENDSAAREHEAREARLREGLRALRERPALELEHLGRSFHAPADLATLTRLRGALPRARLLGGGTDVGLWVTKRLEDLEELIHTARVEELNCLHRAAGRLEIGAAVPLTDAFAALVRDYPELEELFSRFGSPPVRNAGTLGGNIANGSPIGDSMPALMVLGSTLRLASAVGEREVALEDFYLGYQENALGADEVLRSVCVPLPAGDAVFRTYKISKRFDQDISAVCGAFRIELDGSVVRDARIAYGGMAATVRRASHCEAALRGHSWTEATVRAAMEAVAHDYSPLSDMRASAGYRMLVARNLLYRCYLESTGAPTFPVRILAERPAAGLRA